MSSMRPWALVAVVLVTMAACGDDSGGGAVETTTTQEPGVTSTTTSPATTSQPGPAVLPERLASVTQAWNTDWSMTTIDLAELRIGIPASDPRDRITPIDEPEFETIEDADWLAERDPGLLVEIEGEARFYPLAILTLHEIVNDELAGIPIAVTFCPLCNTGLAFDRRVEGTTLRFGVSGLLRNSDLVMWDGLTDSLWQQATGEGIVGVYAGTQLDTIPSAIVSLADFSERHPDGEVLARPLDQFAYPYGLNPYEFYSSRDRPFGFFDGEIDERYPALERVVGLSSDASARAYPFSELADGPVVNDTFDGDPIVILWGGDTADALDTPDIASGQAVGTGAAFWREVDGRVLTFASGDDGMFVDEETGTTWSLLGVATAGPLQGSRLDLYPHQNDFWFAWSAFHPDTEVYTG